MKESKSMQCTVDIVWVHDHLTTALPTLSFKDITKFTLAQVKSHFEIGL